MLGGGPESQAIIWKNLPYLGWEPHTLSLVPIYKEGATI
jgi:hypothetical protein